MASLQVCPVCQEFSSSSNTTLNAHIDQCLSVEPTTKCQASSKPAKLLTKPRMRMMVDIYKASAPSTPEDLDERNGTKRRSSLRSIVDDLDDFSGKNIKVHSSVYYKDATSDRSGVYLDSNAEKLRTLSRVSNAPWSTTSSDSSDESSLLLGRKRNYLVQKLRVFGSPCGSEAQDDLVQNELMQSDVLGFITKRVCSKRTVRGKLSIRGHETTGIREGVDSMKAKTIFPHSGDPKNNQPAVEDHLSPHCKRDTTRLSRNLCSSRVTETGHKDVSVDKDVSSVTMPNVKVRKLRVRRWVPLNNKESIVTVKESHCAANHDKICSPGVDASGFLGEVGTTYQFACESINKAAAEEASSFSRKAVHPSYIVEEYLGLHPETEDYLEPHKNSYTDVASIIIPGPPGCDLPSPGLEGSDELQAHSSLTTYRMQSDDEHEGLDMDFSDSAKSALLSPAADGDDLKSMPTYQPTNQAVFPSTLITPAEVVASAGQEACFYEPNYLQIDPKHWYQSSKPQGRKQSKICDDSSIEYYSLSSISRSPQEQQPLPTSSGFESPRSSPPNPILRLMGKNLMVLNKEDQRNPAPMFSPIPGWPSIIKKVEANLPNQMHHTHCHSSDGFSIPLIDGLASAMNHCKYVNGGGSIH